MDHVVQQVAEVGFVDAEEPLHRGGGQAHLVAHDGGAVGQPARDVLPLDGVGVGEVETGQQGGQRFDRGHMVLGLAQRPRGVRAL
ncbi:hypothetical protein [Streptomyces sp. NPDC058295]|uniref:hypothetical protein n=1 Tax=Streptomyces sp. NPDC058295 TaxID=3346431 RepID=UPI0036E8507D